jgi:penicillin-binding protein 1C
VIALDPDVPPARQRMVFEADGVPAALWLDGTSLGPAGPGAPPLLWAPTPGLHELRLVSAAGEVLDRAAFQVRGQAGTSRPGNGALAGPPSSRPW